MFIGDSRRYHGPGIAPLQHLKHAAQHITVDMRACLLAARVIDRDPSAQGLGSYRLEKDSIGDVLGGMLWPVVAGRRNIPAWRYAWPAVASPAGPTTSPPPEIIGFDNAIFDRKSKEVPGRKDFEFPERPLPGRTTTQRSCPAVPNHAELLPVFETDQATGGWKADDRFVPLKVNFSAPERDGQPSPSVQKIPGPTKCIVFAGNNEEKQSEVVVPILDRLAAPWTATDPALGTIVADIKSGSAQYDERKLARLQSIFRVVVPETGGGVGIGQAPGMVKYGLRLNPGPTIALNITNTRCQDAAGGLCYDTAIDEINARNFAGEIVTLERSFNDTYAALSCRFGGPFCVGPYHDHKHRLGLTREKVPINAMHLNIRAPFIDPSIYHADGPLDYTGESDGNAYTGEWPHVVDFTWYSARMSPWQTYFPGDQFGRFIWRAWVDIDNSDLEEDAPDFYRPPTGLRGVSHDDLFRSGPRDVPPDDVIRGPGRPRRPTGGPAAPEFHLNPGPPRPNENGIARERNLWHVLEREYVPRDYPAEEALRYFGASYWASAAAQSPALQATMAALPSIPMMEDVTKVVTAKDRKAIASGTAKRRRRFAVKTKAKGGGGGGDEQRSFLMTSREVCHPGLVFRPQFFSSGVVDLRNSYGLCDQTVRYIKSSVPITARLESFGRQLNQAWGYNKMPGEGGHHYGKYSTAHGGLALVVPELSLDDLRDGTYPVAGPGLSRTWLILSRFTRLGFGAPSTADGALASGGVAMYFDDLEARVNFAAAQAGGALARIGAVDADGWAFGTTFHKGGGQGIISIGEATTEASSNPAAGGVLWSRPATGALRWRRRDGLVRDLDFASRKESHIVLVQQAFEEVI